MLEFAAISVTWIFYLAILVAKNLSCEKQDRVLFQDLEITMNSGELVLLKGANGAGKTSLLRILVGLSLPTTGEVCINGHNTKSDMNLAAQQLVYCGHKLGFSEILNPIENLLFWSNYTSQACTLDEINSTLQFLELDGLEDLAVKFLSAGQQRRVALAKLWLSKTSNLWVLDEPFTALDSNLVAIIETKIKQFLQAGGSVIMTSHQTVNIDHPAKLMELEYSW